MSGLLPPSALLGYGVLGLPLAFAALPLYVHVPKLYGDSLGLSLGLVGAVLLGARLIDAVLDPLIGWWSDRLAARRVLTAAALPLLAIGLFGLLRPSANLAGFGWLAMFLTLAYLGFSLATINYHAWGAELAGRSHERTRITASREGFALIGVIAASVLPTQLGADLPQGLARTATVFLALLAIAALLTFAGAPAGRSGAPDAAGFRASMAQALSNRGFVRLLAVFALNGIASAIPATLVLFFVADVLGLAERAGIFLAAYFVSGVVALPLWVTLSREIGKPAAWLASMVLAAAAFSFTVSLGAGDFTAFLFVCIASGAALGADLALPPSMLADAIDGDPRAAGAARSGAYFGVWNFVTKLNLALAAGIALPLLALLGYAPGQAGMHGTAALSAVYAGLPVALKLGAAVLLWRSRDRLAGD